MKSLPDFSVSQFVAVFNQTLEFVYPSVTIIGELSNFKISKNRWVYFDLKDEYSSVRFFGSVHRLPGPLQDGMLLRVQGQPRMHPQFGFSINLVNIQLSGQGTIKKAAQLLELKLDAEGLFATDRKRQIPYPPTKIGLIASGESAAYVDFVKILSERWGGIEIQHVDVNVQGEQAPTQIVSAIEYLNAHANEPQVIVVTRGGGSPEDLQAFNTEQVTRAVAASRVPTLIAIGHEIDISLAERAADLRASTPSNAAELLVPDKKNEQAQLLVVKKRLSGDLLNLHKQQVEAIKELKLRLGQSIETLLENEESKTGQYLRTLELLNPSAVLKRGYALLQKNGQYLARGYSINPGDEVTIILHAMKLRAKIIAKE
jgi:exodeoxyribonuclease VII large subunit